MHVTAKTMLATAIGALAAALIALAVSANAQTPQEERIVGYSVYAHSHYVLLQRPDGRLRTCTVQRQTVLRPAPDWTCTELGPLR